MRVIGFNFTKIDVEKFSEPKEGVKIQTTVDVTDIKEMKTDILKSKDDLLEVKFSYGVKYEPKVAEIGIKGTILVSINPKESKEVLKAWKKKEISEQFKFYVLNIVMRKSGLRAAILEDEFNLPLHVPMPSLRRPEKK